MRCQNCGEEIGRGEFSWAHTVTDRIECVTSAVATPPPDDQPNVTPVDGR